MSSVRGFVAVRQRRDFMKPYSELDGVLVGPPKTATTWIATQLRSHPDVFCPSEDQFLTLRRPRTLKELRAKYEGSGGHACVLNYATTYSYFEGIPEELHALNPDMKIVISVRDPVDRAISNIRHDWRMGGVARRHSVSFLISPYMLGNRYLEPGLYHKHVKRWADVFGPSNLFVFPFPGDVEDPTPWLRKLLSFLDVDGGDASFDTERVYRTKRPLVPELHYRSRFGTTWFRKLLRFIDRLNCWLGERLVSWEVEEEAKQQMRAFFNEECVRGNLEDLLDDLDIAGGLGSRPWGDSG